MTELERIVEKLEYFSNAALLPVELALKQMERMRADGIDVIDCTRRASVTVYADDLLRLIASWRRYRDALRKTIKGPDGYCCDDCHRCFAISIAQEALSEEK